jgi:hypothetical protein
VNDFRFRCSSLAELMTNPRSIDPELLDDTTRPIAAKKVKTPEDHAILSPLYDYSLSAGAKTMLNEIAKEQVYGFHYVASSKYTEKGTIVEDQAIALYNERFFTNYKKNTERRQNDFITGECDVFTGRKIIDTKSSWSLKTFPAIDEEGYDTTYEWQMRGYMWLWDADEAIVAYCLVDTPEELIGREDPALHRFDHLPIEMRITTVSYLRDREKEAQIERKLSAAYHYLEQRRLRILEQHQP